MGSKLGGEPRDFESRNESKRKEQQLEEHGGWWAGPNCTEKHSNRTVIVCCEQEEAEWHLGEERALRKINKLSPD